MLHRKYYWSWELKTISSFIVCVVLDRVCQYACAEVKIKCSNIDEFCYSVPESRCTSYYKCTSRGHREVKTCGPGSMFDFYTQSCIRSPDICYEPNCANRPNGIYQDTSHACRRSFTCHSGRLINIDNCPPKQLHNGARCVSQDLVMCDLSQNTAIGYPFSGDNRCASKVDGFHPVNGCREFVYCENGKLKDLQTCLDGYLFNVDNKECIPEEFVSYCPGENTIAANDLICVGQSDGLHHDPESRDCSSYIVCKNNEVIAQHKCGAEAVFNGEGCVPSILFSCRLNADLQLNQDICNSKKNGYNADPQHGCSTYVNCMEGQVLAVAKCPAGHYFDPDERKCVFEKFPGHRKCFEVGLSHDCTGKLNIFYSDIGCQSYYHCIRGRKTQYICPNGKLFNGETCVPESQYSCNTEIDDFCLNRPDGYYKDESGGCRSYHYCSSGHKITYLCEVGHVFDGEKCSRPSRSNQCLSDSLCYGKSDGYHSDVRSNCRNYVFCKNYEKITQLTCRGNKVFNGQKCVSPSEHACPSLYNYRQLNCIPRKCFEQKCTNDGFFPDIDSGCRKYFFCIGGKVSSLSCPTGKRFNGEICVTEDKFTCPVYCDTESILSNINCPLSGSK